ncbi:MAG: HAMP domain-containing protein, partial [Bacteroidetes bacterium]|nr:HAMP domain-containing protein [Bacteroidota bacterium]
MRAPLFNTFMHMRIRWKLVTLIGAVLLVFACFFLLYIPYRVGQIGESALAAKARVVTAMTAASVTPALLFQDTLQISEELRTAMLSNDVRYAVVMDDRGGVQASLNLQEAIRCDYLETSFKGNIAENVDVWQTREKIGHRNIDLGELYMGFSRLEVGTRKSLVITETAVVTLIVFVIGLLSVIGISGAVTSHLKTVVATARAVSAGDLQSRAAEGFGDEVGELAKSFNTMLDNLTIARQNLEEANKDLETRVMLRTQALNDEVAGHRRTEESLRLTEQRQRQIIDLVPDFIFAKDEDGRFVVANEAVARAYGTTVDQLLGKRDADFAQSEEEVRRFRQVDREIITSGEQRLIPEETITIATGEVRTLQTVKIPFTLS